jgi:hypothetical protein
LATLLARSVELEATLVPIRHVFDLVDNFPRGHLPTVRSRFK